VATTSYEPEESIYNRLKGHAGLSALVSTRIYPMERPQGTPLPAVTFERVSGVPVHAMSADANYMTSRYQINSYADDLLEAKTVAYQTEKALSRWSSTTGAVEILETFVDNIYNVSEELGGSDVGVHHVALDILMVHRTS